MGEEAIRVAIVHDWLVTIAGAEKVLIELLRLFPDADLFSIVDLLDEKGRAKLFGKRAKSSFIQKLPFKKHFRLYLPLFPKAVEGFDLKEYDLIISSSWAFAKGIRKYPHQKHICYCHTPIRYAWDLRDEYLLQTPLPMRPIVGAVLAWIRLWDQKSAKRVDRFVANSTCVQERIRHIYHRESTLIHPPVDVHRFTPQKKEDYYLTLSRLVPYKKTALIVEAFNQMPHRKLKVIGTGPEYTKIKKMARSNVEVLGYLGDQEVAELMGRAKAFVYGANEDFGIVMAEALASGTPVIAYGRCGALDIVQRGGILFDRQTPQAIQKAVERFERMRFDNEELREFALQFQPSEFRRKFQKVVDEIF